jgi:hypothetical protein
MSIIKHKGQRVAVFIDTQNLYHCAKNLYHARVNFGAILKEAVADRVLIRAIAYVITTESGEEKNFLDALEKQVERIAWAKVEVAVVDVEVK